MAEEHGEPRHTEGTQSTGRACPGHARGQERGQFLRTKHGHDPDRVLAARPDQAPKRSGSSGATFPEKGDRALSLPNSVSLRLHRDAATAIAHDSDDFWGITRP